ncbi:MAG TPA: VWA domain-containing protein [Blastocatellia bacterium]|nr:VWA domain-containing protein [Blastocatellia bacterium]
MRFLSSSAFWWLLLGAIIVLLYLLRIKRKRTLVPSVILWKRALEELDANAPFKKLRRNLLLVLQLLALAAIVFALARPLVTTRALAAGSTIIVIDSTASMSARDEAAGTRLDRAKQLAREMIDGLGGSDRAALVESSSRVTIRSPLTSDRAALASAIDEIQPTDAPGNLTDALRLSEQIARSQAEATIVIIGDGGSAIDMENDPALGRPARVASTEQKAAVRFVRVGRRAANVGIVAMNSRPLPGTSRRELFASIANFGDNSQSVSVELQIDGRLIDARTIEVASGDKTALLFGALPSEAGLAELKLIHDDDLASDNIAYALVPGARRTSVGVMSENPFLLQALASNPDLDVGRVTAGSANPQFDCLVSEGAPAEALASNRPLLLINPPESPGLWRTLGKREQPEVTSVERSHPVNAFLTYADLHVESAPRREAARWLKPIVSAGNDPLIWAGDDGHRRVVLIGFDLAQSDLPLKVEFPILLANSLAWLASRDLPAALRVVQPGQPAIIPSSGANATITTPAGDSEQIDSQEGSVVFANTLRIGKYEVKDSTPFAVSLLSEAESNTMPRDSIKTRDGEVKGQAGTFQSEREVWRWIALLAVVVLSLEWWVYHRRVSI